MTILRLDLEQNPVPLARARVYAQGGRYHARTPERSRAFAASFAQELTLRIRGRRPAFPTGDVHLHLELWRRCRSIMDRGDLDNLVKAVTDAATGILWHDDRQVRSLSARIVDYGPTVDGRVRLQVAPIADPTPGTAAVTVNVSPPDLDEARAAGYAAGLADGALSRRGAR